MDKVYTIIKKVIAVLYSLFCPCEKGGYFSLYGKMSLNIIDPFCLFGINYSSDTCLISWRKISGNAELKFLWCHYVYCVIVRNGLRPQATGDA